MICHPHYEISWDSQKELIRFRHTNMSSFLGQFIVNKHKLNCRDYTILQKRKRGKEGMDEKGMKGG